MSCCTNLLSSSACLCWCCLDVSCLVWLSLQIINDNMMYAKIVVRMGVRTECKNCDFSDILEDEDVRRRLSYYSYHCCSLENYQCCSLENYHYCC